MAKKRPRSKGKASDATAIASALAGFPMVLSTAMRSALNMLVVTIAFGSVLVCLFAAKRIF